MKNKSLVVIIAHQDDEFCIFNRIYKKKNNFGAPGGGPGPEDLKKL